MSVYTKLNQARMNLQGKKLNKTGLNKFAGYKYFELADFLPTVQEIFSTIGLCGVVSFSDAIATLTITDTEDGSQIVITSPMGSAALKGVHEVQNIGAVETYQRRYLWVSAMEIVEHDALDATTGKEKPVSGGVRHSPTAGELEKLPPDIQEHIKDLAMEVIGAFHGNVDEQASMVRTVEEQNLDDSQKTALWSLLDSKTRAAFKKTAQSLQAA